MRAFQIWSLVTTILLSVSLNANCQDKIATLNVHHVSSAYVDRPGDLYIIQQGDSLTKIDISGKVVDKASLHGVTTFDPRDGARSFMYYKSSQQFGFFTGSAGTTHIVHQEYAIEPIMACSSGDNQAWILDKADWSLKRVNPLQSMVVVDAQIDLKQFNATPEIIFMREYQGFLFMIEKSAGIIIFNSLGRQIKKIKEPGIRSLNFLGEELYYLKAGKLIFYDLFDMTTREIQVDPDCNFILLTDVRKYVIYPDKIEIFKNP